jgi:hypothetical protein
VIDNNVEQARVKGVNKVKEVKARVGHPFVEEARAKSLYQGTGLLVPIGNNLKNLGLWPLLAFLPRQGFEAKRIFSR